MIVTNSNPGVSIQYIKCLIEMLSEPGKSNQGPRIAKDFTTTIFIGIERHRIRLQLQQMGDFRLAITTRPWWMDKLCQIKEILNYLIHSIWSWKNWWRSYKSRIKDKQIPTSHHYLFIFTHHRTQNQSISRGKMVFLRAQDHHSYHTGQWHSTGVKRFRHRSHAWKMHLGWDSVLQVNKKDRRQHLVV